MEANAIQKLPKEPLFVRRNWLRFWIRRFFRIAPAYYVSLALAILSSAHFLTGYQELQSLNPKLWPLGGTYDPSKVDYTVDNILIHLTLLFGVHPQYSFSTFLPDWSLSLEMQFYLAYPVLFCSMRKLGTLRVAILVGLVGAWVGHEISRLIPYPEPSLLCFKLNFFLAGVLLWHCIGEERFEKKLACGLSAILLTSLEPQQGMQGAVLPTLMALMIILGLLESMGRLPGKSFEFVNSRAVHFCSEMSYAVYLFHGFFISASGLVIKNSSALLSLAPPQRTLLLAITVATLSYALAYFVHRLIEIPGVRLGKLILDRLIPVERMKSSS